MPRVEDAYCKIVKQIEAGQRVWVAPRQTKDALIQFHREVVIPLRSLKARGTLSLVEHIGLQRGAHFVERIEITGEVRIEI